MAESNWVYLNKETKEAYVYSGGWAPIGQGDVDLIWQGELNSAPALPSLHWAYFNTETRMVYVYDGTTWNILAGGGSMIKALDDSDAESRSTSDPNNFYYVVE